jgi:hypothetical protein
VAWRRRHEPNRLLLDRHALDEIAPKRVDVPDFLVDEHAARQVATDLMDSHLHFELVRTLKEADVIAVLGIRGQPVVVVAPPP